MGLASRLFKLRRGEAGILFTLGLLLLSNSLAIEVSEVVSISGFLSQVGVPQILIVWFVDMVLVILTAGLQSLIVDRFKRANLMRWMCFAIALVYLLLRLMFTFGIPDWLNYSFLFLLADQQWLFFPLLFWVLANDVLDVAQTKRLFPLIATFAFVGQIVGLGISAVAPSLLARVNASSTDLLSLNALIYLVAFLVASVGLRNVQVRETVRKHETMRKTLTEGWGFIREVFSFRYLMLTMVAVSLTITILDFHFLSVSDAAFTDPNSFQTFYSLYRLGSTVVSILVQSFLTSRIINRVGLKNTFLLMPSSLLISAAVATVFPGVASATGGIAFSRLTQETVDESARKAFQALVPEERRGRVSMFMDSYMFAVGAIIGCVITGPIVFIGQMLGSTTYFYIYLAAANVTALIAFWTVFSMRRVYESSLLNWRLKRRQRRGLTGVMGKLNFDD